MVVQWTVVGLGEALFDIAKDQETLGGAPLNAAVHAHQMLTAMGQGQGVVVSRVGYDERGRNILQALRRFGMTTHHIQTDLDHPTGRVFVEKLADDEVAYEILPGAAYDYLKFSLNLEALANECQAICFGSLAQRSHRSRSTIAMMLHHAPQALKLYDVNLRKNTYTREEGYSPEILQQSCELADIVKVNRKELKDVCALLNLDHEQGTSDANDDRRADALRRAFDLDLVMLTRDRQGVVLYGDEKVVGAPVPEQECPRDPEPVGAGDACSATLLVGQLFGWELSRTAAVANRVGAYVASQSTATPVLPEWLLRLFE